VEQIRPQHEKTIGPLLELEAHPVARWARRQVRRPRPWKQARAASMLDVARLRAALAAAGMELNPARRRAFAP